MKSGRTKLAALLAALGVIAVAATAGWLGLRGNDEDPSVRRLAAPPVEVPRVAPRPRFGVLRSRIRQIDRFRTPRSRGTPSERWAKLVAAARTNGLVPVIVQLKGPGELLGPLAPLAQRAVIARTVRSATRALLGTRYTHLKQFRTAPVIALRASPAAINALRRSGLVAAIAQEQPMPLPERQPGSELSPPEAVEKLETDWNIRVTSMRKAWTEGYDGRGMVVAVLDSGVDATHDWLMGKVAYEACFSSDGNCPGGKTAVGGSGTGRPCSYAPANCSHGTHTAHTAAGDYGVARGATIAAVQVFSKAVGKACRKNDLPSPCALSWPSDQMKGLEFAYLLRRQERIPIASVNVSLGGGKYGRHCDAVENYDVFVANLRNAGVATFISSGNDGYKNGIGHPACVPGAVSVGASTLRRGKDAVASFSNSARILNLLAPGDDIYSAVPGNGADSWDGTSMASPHAAGAFAVLRQLQPSGPARPLLRALANSGPRVRDRRNGLRKPRINVWRALVRLYNS